MREFLAGLAAVLALTAVAIAIGYVALRPNEFKVAIPHANTIDQRVFGIAADTMRSQRASVRLEVVQVENTQAAMDALESGKVKFAVVRSDAALQGRAHTVMIMRREAGIMIAAKAGKMRKVNDLPNAMLGITRNATSDGSLLWPVLDYYGIPRDKAKQMPLPHEEIASAFRQKKIDAMIVVGPLTSKPVSEAVTEAVRGTKGAIEFIEIEEADAIAKRLPALEVIEVEQGAFGGRPPRPAESINTLGFSIRLVATPKADTDHVSELVTQLYQMRQNISAAVPGAGLMETPDTDEATPFLIHPGVRAYTNGDQKTLFDRYSDWIYFGAFILSGLGSLAAGFFHWAGGDKVHPTRENFEKIESLLDSVRTAPTREALEAVEREADAIFRWVFELGASDKLSDGAVASFTLAMNELRKRIAERRATLPA